LHAVHNRPKCLARTVELGFARSDIAITPARSLGRNGCVTDDNHVALAASFKRVHQLRVGRIVMVGRVADIMVHPRRTRGYAIR
jgi:hypothetical protein